MDPHIESQHVKEKKIKQCILIISGMTCTVCSNTIETHLSTVKGIDTVAVSLLTHKAAIEYEAEHIGIRTIIEEIECLGFDAKYEP